MTERLEQRYCIKFFQKLGDSQVETIRKIQTAFGDDAMGITQIKEWYNRFKDGRISVESEPRSGRPSTCRNDQVIAKVNAVVMRRVTLAMTWSYRHVDGRPERGSLSTDVRPFLNHSLICVMPIASSLKAV